MSANAYARIAERYQVSASDDEAVERFFLDVAPTLSREEREAIVAELLANETVEVPPSATTEVPLDVPTFSIDDAPPVARPTLLTQLVVELSAAVEKRVSDRLDAVITRAFDRLEEHAAPASRRRYERDQLPRIADLIEGQTVTAIESRWTVLMAAQWMTARNIGAVPVVHEGALAGILSEHDLMSRVTAKGLNPENTAVAAVMTTEIVVVQPADDVGSALQKMHAIGSRHLLVVQDGKLVGMLSIRDLPDDLPDVEDFFIAAT